jgi:site-specific recombinase XerD
MSKLFKLAEVASITGENLETLKTRSKRGEFPTVLFQEGKKKVKGVTQETLASLLQDKQYGGYEDYRKDWIAEMEAGTHVKDAAPVSSGYIKDLEWGLYKYWKVLGVSESLERLNASNLDLVFQHFKPSEQKRRDYYSTKMHIYKAVSGFVRYLVKRGCKQESDLEKIRQSRPKARYKPQRHAMTLDEIWRAIDFNSSWISGRTRNDIYTTEMLLYLYAFAGLRKMEAANLEISGVNFETNEILVHGKWGKDRFVPMPKELAEKLHEWIHNLRPESNLPNLLVTHLGTKLTERSIGCRFIRLSKAMKTPIRPHGLRYNYAGILSEQGMDVYQIQEVLGHSDIQTTMKYIGAGRKKRRDFIANDFSVLPSLPPEGIKSVRSGVSTVRPKKRSSGLIV